MPGEENAESTTGQFGLKSLRDLPGASIFNKEKFHQSKSINASSFSAMTVTKVTECGTSSEKTNNCSDDVIKVQTGTGSLIPAASKLRCNEQSKISKNSHFSDGATRWNGHDDRTETLYY